MKFRAETSRMTPLEIRAMAAFFNVMAGRQPVSPPDVADPEIDKMVSDFIDKVRAEPAPTEDASGMASAFDAIVPEVVEVAKDANGDEWDVDRHSSPPKLTESGLWRKRRNVAKEVVSAGAEIVPETLQDKELEVVLSDPNPEPATVEDASNSGENEPETLSEAAGDADRTEPTFTEEEVEAAPSMSAAQTEFWNLIDAADSWLKFKHALNGFTRSSEFVGWSPARQHALRSNIWKTAAEFLTPKPDHTADVTAFACWIYAATDGEQILDAFKLLQKVEGFRGLPAEAQKRVEKNVAERVAALISA